MLKFDEGFVFGTATSSYQIEGARHEDGRTDSIWDTFSRVPGKVANGDTGDIACDHYHRYEEDLELMKELGVESYRFSIAWPRIFPQKGQYNQAGMAFYKALIRQLKDKGIKPSVTLYHWDLPQWMEDMGGWTNRDSVVHFVEFAKKCYQELGDDVEFWITHNEPFCAGILGYMTGDHAPGKQDVRASLQAIHHILLSHGEAVKAYRKTGLSGKIGITLNHTPAEAASASLQDQLAANNYDGWMNRWFLDPVFKQSYPVDMINLYHQEMDFIQEGDLATIGQAIDFFGINFYHSAVVEYAPDHPLFYRMADMDVKKTAMGWPITPQGLDTIITRIRKDYTDLPIYITENGAAFDDVVSDDGSVQDTDRVEYLDAHLKTVVKMNQKGLNVAGYYLWSFMDNFEWAYGYDKRFGIVYVDFESLERTPKASFYRYQEIIRDRVVE